MFIAGRYTASYAGLAAGQTADGYKLMWQFFKRLITGDAMAESPQDAVFRGGSVEVGFTAIEYDAACMQSLMWPYGTFLELGAVGRTDKGSSLTKPLILTAVAGTPAANAPNAFTLDDTILKEGFPIEILLAPDLREVPLRLRAYPANADQYAGKFGNAQ